MEENYHILTRSDLDSLLSNLRAEGFQVVAPQPSGGAMMTAPLAEGESLPSGYRERQAPGSYTLEASDDGSLFSYTLPMQSWRRYVNPPEETLFRSTIHENGFTIEEGSAGSFAPKTALVGVRVCDLSGLKVLDHTFAGSSYPDPRYQKKRDSLFIIAVDCLVTASTCFCSSMGLGPVHREGFDIALSEIEPDRLLARAGEKGRSFLQNFPRAGEEEIAKLRRSAEASEKSITRTFDLERAKGVLEANPDHPHWDEVATRCLSCANCTLVCPTCFCTSVDEAPALGGASSERVRRWDSCFHVSHSYIHGGHIRASVKSRYRQWLMHKILHTREQSGESGCTGCGRCLTWCPAAIDFTEDLKNISGKESHDVST